VTVTALLVSHDGARWLPAVLDGLRGQQHRPDRVIAVDTGSSDESVDLLTAALGAAAVRAHTGSFPEAVATAMDEIDTDWVWILHDDANPAPDALAILLAAAQERGAAVVGPKLREWPSLRRLLEVGVTISATGRRETGLERGEYDQGQHDTIREVLAVNTAGMLVRRDALLAVGGFDPALPLYGNDIDFGWRIARAGLRTIVAPDAVVFHAEAAHRGVRRSALSGRRTRTHRYEREAAMYTLLANTEGRWAWLEALRLVVGTLLRTVGFLLARQPGHAGDEFAALLGTVGDLGAIRAARAQRAQLTGGDPERIRRLLAPWWLPYRHGLDVLGDFVNALALQGRDAADRRREARAVRLGLPVRPPVEEDELEVDTGLLARFLTSPLALSLTVLAVLGLWAARVALGPIAGGALSPAPAAASEWWDLVTQGWHQLGQGTDAPAPGYLLPFAALAAVFGSPTVVVSLLFLVAVPFAGWGAWRFLRAVGELTTGRSDSAVICWGALAYSAVPVASGAWGQGRFGIVASAALLPWLAHAVTGLFETSADRRWRAAWRGGALLALVTAFTPSAWLVAVLGVLVLIGLGLLLAPTVVRSASVWAPLVVVLVVPAVLLLPGAVGMIGHDPAALFLEAGRLAPTPGPWDLLSGRLGGLGAPHWFGVLLLVPGLLALLRPRTRMPVLACWILIAVAAVVATVLSRITVELPAGPVRPGLGFLVVVIQGALVTAAVAAAQGLRPAFGRDALGWRQVAGVVGLAAAVLVPLGGLGWWVVTGDDDLHRPLASDVPAYMVQASEDGLGHGVLVIRGDVPHGLTWEVHRGDGVTLGEDEVLALTGPDAAVDKAVASLVSRPTPEVLATLTREGIDYVLLPAPASGQVAATLDAADGLAQASATDRRTRAWQLADVARGDAVDRPQPLLHGLLVALQLLAVIVIAVLCGPTRREEDA
jgi:GT2 family glycosyltransferase